MRWLIFIVVHVAKVLCEEPQCSKFHYEAQTLEKMIRTEIKVEAMEKEILKNNQLIQDSLQALEDALQALKNERENLGNDYAMAKKSILDDNEKLKQNYVEQERRILDEKEILKQGIADLKQNLLAETKVIKDTLIIPEIVFKARHVTDTSLVTDQTIVFSTIMIMLNEGGAYDNTTGIFRAPVSGTYLFTIHLCVSNSKVMYYGIVCDNVVNTSGLFYASSSLMCTSADAILTLRPGQKIWVKCTHGQSGDVLYQTEYTAPAYNYWNTFSGTLIHK